MSVNKPFHFAVIVPPTPPEARYFDELLLRDLSPHTVSRMSCRGASDGLPHALSELCTRHVTAAQEGSIGASPVVPVHQLVNDPSVRSELIVLGAHPGVVFVHDCVLDQHGPEAIINSGFSDTVGLIDGRVTDFPERGKSYHRERYYAVRELSLAVLPIFTDARMHAAFLRRTDPSLAVGSAYLPWPVEVQERCYSAQQSSSGMTLRKKRIGVATNHHAFERWEMHRLLEALERSGVAREIELCWLVRDEACVRQVERFAATFPTVQLSVECGLTPHRWQEFVRRIDLAVHLQGGMFGQLGPYLPISLGSGVPVVTTQAHAELFPRDAIFAVRSGGPLAEELSALCVALVRGELPTDNQVGAEFVRHTHAPSVVRRELLQVIMRFGPLLSLRMAEIAALAQRAHAEILREISVPPVVRPVFEEMDWLPPQSASRASRSAAGGIAQ